MKVKLREKVYIPTSTKKFTCKGCVFLSDNNAICKAQILYIHPVFVLSNYSVVLKNVLKYLTYENRIQWYLY